MTENDTIFSFEQNCDFFRRYLGEEGFPGGHNYVLTNFEMDRYYTIKEEIQQRAKRQKEFFVLVDLVGDGKVPRLALPYRHENLFAQADQLDFSHFIHSIHPHYQQVYMWWGQASYLAAALPQVKPMLQAGQDLKYIFTLPFCKDLRKAENQREYEWWQQSGEILRLSPQKRILAHINRYRYFHPFHSNTQSGAIFSDVEMAQSSQPYLMQVLKAHLLPALLNSLPQNEVRILKAHLDGYQTTAQVAEHSSYPPTTVRTYASRLLKRINPPLPLFPFREFTTLKKAVAHLQSIIQ